MDRVSSGDSELSRASRVISSQRFRRETVAPERTSISRAFESTGIEFIDENGGGPGVRLKKPPKKARDRRGRRRPAEGSKGDDQWRICFEWPEGSPGPINVEIVDYH